MEAKPLRGVSADWPQREGTRGETGIDDVSEEKTSSMLPPTGSSFFPFFFMIKDKNIILNRIDSNARSYSIQRKIGCLAGWPNGSGRRGSFTCRRLLQYRSLGLFPIPARLQREVTRVFTIHRKTMPQQPSLSPFPPPQPSNGGYLLPTTRPLRSSQPPLQIRATSQPISLKLRHARVLRYHRNNSRPQLLPLRHRPLLSSPPFLLLSSTLLPLLYLCPRRRPQRQQLLKLPPWLLPLVLPAHPPELTTPISPNNSWPSRCNSATSSSNPPEPLLRVPSPPDLSLSALRVPSPLLPSKTIRPVTSVPLFYLPRCNSSSIISKSWLPLPKRPPPTRTKSRRNHLFFFFFFLRT